MHYHFQRVKSEKSIECPSEEKCQCMASDGIWKQNTNLATTFFAIVNLPKINQKMDLHIFCNSSPPLIVAALALRPAKWNRQIK